MSAAKIPSMSMLRLYSLRRTPSPCCAPANSPAIAPTPVVAAEIRSPAKIVESA